MFGEENKNNTDDDSMQEKYKGMSVGEVLDIETSSEWLHDKMEIVSEYFKSHEEELNFTTIHFLMSSGEVALLMAIKLGGLEKGLGKLVKFFYSIGYMRGIKSVEKKEKEEENIRQLGKMWENGGEQGSGKEAKPDANA